MSKKVNPPKLDDDNNSNFGLKNHKFEFKDKNKSINKVDNNFKVANIGIAINSNEKAVIIDATIAANIKLLKTKKYFKKWLLYKYCGLWVIIYCI